MNTGYRDYAQIAYRRAIVSSLLRYLQEHVSTEGPSTLSLECEEVLASDREVPEEYFLEYMEKLQFEEQDLRLQLSQFEFVRRTDVRGKQEEAAPAGPTKEDAAKATAKQAKA